MIQNQSLLLVKYIRAVNIISWELEFPTHLLLLETPVKTYVNKTFEYIYNLILAYTGL